MSSLAELEEKMQAWSDLERAALVAEDAAWAGGHSPEAAALANAAARQRRIADEALNAVLSLAGAKSAVEPEVGSCPDEHVEVG